MNERERFFTPALTNASMASLLRKGFGLQHSAPARTTNHVSLQIFCAELFGMALFVYFSDAVAAQVVLGRLHARQMATAEELVTPDVLEYGDHFTVAVGRGAGLILAVIASGSVSGGHLNPAVTLVEVFLRRLPATVLPIYFIAQCFGAFIGAGLVHTVHAAALNEDDEWSEEDASPVYYTTPLNHEYSKNIIAWDQILGSAIFMYVYSAMDDKCTGIRSKPVKVILVGITYGLLYLATGINSGSALNPARDFVPRIFAFVVEYRNAFKEGRGFAWLALLMPFVGCLFGGILYECLVRSLRSEDEKEEDKPTPLEEIKGRLEAMEETLGRIGPTLYSTAETEGSQLEREATPSHWKRTKCPVGQIASSV